jgi:uncharacterized protein YndB with AHSA1/START domain
LALGKIQRSTKHLAHSRLYKSREVANRPALTDVTALSYKRLWPGKEICMSQIEIKSDKQTLEHSIVITRDFDAPPALVFKCWTEPDRIKQWFSPKGFTTPHCTSDLRVGGECIVCMRSPEGKEFWSKGIYREIIEPYRIVRTDEFCDEKGNHVSPEKYGMPNWPDETTVTANFTEQAGRTRIKIQHSPVKPSKERDMCQQGWNECLDKLDEYLKKEKKI